MRIIEWPRFLEEASPLGGKPSAITVGVFDGVHRGHRALIEQIISHRCAASKVEAVPVVITFMQGRHKKNGGRQEYPGDILSFRQKIAIFESLGVSVTIAMELTDAVRKMAGGEFLRILHEHGKMSFMAVGSNFRCGYQLDTDAPAIQRFNEERGVPTCILPSLKEGADPISSALIRSAVCQGRLAAAAAMLGRPFTLDLSGAAISAAANAPGSAWDIAAEGRVLPPPGSYPVLLYGKNGGPGTPAEIAIEGGKLVIGGDLAGISPEYAEFVPSNSAPVTQSVPVTHTCLDKNL